jgi:hypothetical protein
MEVGRGGNVVIPAKRIKHWLCFNFFKLHIAIRLYESGGDPMDVVVRGHDPKVPHRSLDTDHLCGLTSCVQDGHAGLSTNRQNLDRARCHNGTRCAL